MRTEYYSFLNHSFKPDKSYMLSQMKKQKGKHYSGAFTARPALISQVGVCVFQKTTTHEFCCRILACAWNGQDGVLLLLTTSVENVRSTGISVT